MHPEASPLNFFASACKTSNACRILLVLAICISASAQGAPVRHKKSSKPAVTRVSPLPYDQRPEVLRFIDDMSMQHQFDKAELMRLFASARYNDNVAALMTPAVTPSGTVVKNWRVYRSHFIEPKRIDAGMQFWQEHGDALQRATQEYGVPAEIIVGIIGVETIYGRITGNYRVIDALSTLAFDYPNPARDRSAMFREQLEDFLLFARDDGIDALELRGSFAGAIGIPQFMPTSLRRYAVDFDHDGHIDLLGSNDDAIGSVANFLVQHGWQTGLPTYYPAQVAINAEPEDIQRLIDAGSVPSFDAPSLANAGVVFTEAIAPEQMLALIDLPNQSRDGSIYPTEYVLGTQNFHAITRYNHSYFYAMAVIELGNAVKTKMANLSSP